MSGLNGKLEEVLGRIEALHVNSQRVRDVEPTDEWGMRAANLIERDVTEILGLLQQYREGVTGSANVRVVQTIDV